MSNGSGCERGPGTRQVQLAGGAEEGLGPSGFFGIFFFFCTWVWLNCFQSCAGSTFWSHSHMESLAGNPLFGSMLVYRGVCWELPIEC